MTTTASADAGTGDGAPGGITVAAADAAANTVAVPPKLVPLIGDCDTLYMRLPILG